MVYSTPKPFSELLEALGAHRALVLVGCSECAAISQSGGSAQVEELEQRLGEAGYQVLATADLPSPCDRRLTRRDLKRLTGELARADALVCLACGSGVQALAGLVEVPVVAGLDSHFVASVERLGLFHGECTLCGACLLNHTEGFCPVTRCPKGLRNGPCEGGENGRCEADPDLECVWETIHARLAADGRSQEYTRLHPAVDAGRWGRPRSTRSRREGAQ